ncbi:MAG TPA: hypothetical protein GX700_04660, partial [Paracoccus sp.]|nr:hypothetical protein [Paracoccus sp. (in: a-proteobacteria)]
QARAFLAGISPASETAGADLACRAELALLDADWPAATADLAKLKPWPAHRQRLFLQRLHLRDGAAALGAALDRCPVARTEHWQLALSCLVSARDFTRARPFLAQAEAHHGAVATRDARIRLALDCDNPATALTLLEPDLPANPARWSARQHEHWLRAMLLRARQERQERQGGAPLLPHASAALRLFPRNGALQSLWLTCRALEEDWRSFEAGLHALPGPAAVSALNRLGLFEAAQARTEAEFATLTGANPRARRLLALAQSHLLQGAPDLAEAALVQAATPLPPAPTRADLNWLSGEIALWRFDPAAAEAALAPLRTECPTHPGLWLSLSRAAFLRGEFPSAEAALARFRALKASQTGTPPATDLRDLITMDALKASTTLEPGLMGKPLETIVKKAGIEAITASPGLSACLLARAAPHPFIPAQGPPIPQRLNFYWEGPESGAVARSVAAWRALNPGLDVTLFDARTAADWLTRHHPALLPLFQRQPLPATRADLFRIALLLTEGGIYVDVDEYPRAAIDDWLTGAQAVFCQEIGYGTVANNFIAARPGLDLLARMLARIAGRLAQSESVYPWWDSGPAPLSATVFEALYGPAPLPGLRLLDQASYCQRISTNLAFPHKRGPRHWR